MPIPDEKTKQDFKRVEDAIDKNFNKKKVMRLLLQRVKNSFSQKELKMMNDFIGSPLGKRLTEIGIKMVDEKEGDRSEL